VKGDGSIAIIDFGSQFTQLIARRVRELMVFSRIVPCHGAMELLGDHQPSGIILSGGPASVTESDAPTIDRKVFDLGIPVLGICYGMQVMSELLGGRVAASHHREYGFMKVAVKEPEGIFDGFDREGETVVWMSHGDRVEQLPGGWKVLGRSVNSPMAAIGRPDKGLYGVQFHPEVHHTIEGDRMIGNFLFKVCGIKPSWTPRSFIEESTAAIAKTVGPGRVISALSGGVDSSVASVLVHRAVGSSITCIFVDNGLLRMNEAREVEDVFGHTFSLPLVVVDARDRFLSALRGVKDPEEKRKIIGRLFIEIFEEEAGRIGKVDYLVQGTLYPDIIESVSARGGPSATIKSHHNVGGLPEKMNLRLIEPLRELFKDEVRKVGQELGIPDSIIKRQPFPGPGLAVRIIGEVTRERTEILKEADAIIEAEIKDAGYYDILWQSFGILVPAVRTVGVMGDSRTYQHLLALRAVTSRDAMTADWARLPYELLAAISTRIINEVDGINRVVYDISTKPPATIEWE
jgi:GMP synthase (glutamine-hydrolysing)